MHGRRVRIAAIADFPAGRALRVILPDDDVAVWQIDGAYHAVSAVCRHHFVPTLHEGTREGLTVSCPLHGWTYSLETGEALRGGGRVRVYVTEVENGVVWIRLPEPEDDEHAA